MHILDFSPNFNKEDFLQYIMNTDEQIDFSSISFCLFIYGKTIVVSQQKERKC